MDDMVYSTKKDSKLKELVSGSTWVSPFRSPLLKKNLYKEYKNQNVISNIKVPKKFTNHPTLEAEEIAKKQEKRYNKEVANEYKTEEEYISTSITSLKDISIENSENENDKENEQEDKKYEKGDRKENEKGKESENIKDKENDNAKTELGNNTENYESKSKVLDKTERIKPTEKYIGKTSKDIVENYIKESSEIEETANKDDKDIDKDIGHVLNDDNIQVQVKKTPIDIVTQPEVKYESVKSPDEKILSKLQEKPLLLNHYHELNTIAIGSISNTLDDSKKIIDLGSGMKMTQQQLLDIAAKRVGPVLANINEEVTKTRNEDEIKRKNELSNKIKDHEKKLFADFEKYLKKITKQKEKFNREADNKIEELTTMIKNANINTADFEKTINQEIETARKEFKDRELKAVEQHDNAKKTLIKNHEEFVATMKQELKNSKINQEKITEEIKILQKKKVQLYNINGELFTQIEKLRTKLDENLNTLNDLKSKHFEKQKFISNLSKKEKLDNKIATFKKELEEKKAKHDSLVSEIDILAATLTDYSSKLPSLVKDKKTHANILKDDKLRNKDLFDEIFKDNEYKQGEAQEVAGNKKTEGEPKKQRDEKKTQKLEQTSKDKKKKGHIYNEKMQQGEKDVLQLRKGNEQLNTQNATKADSEKSKDEKLAQSAQRELNGIEILKKEHSAKLKLYRKRLIFEELQKTKLLEEVENLKKIRELREEKAILSTEISKNTELDDIQRLIEERELEIAKLSKQIELDENLYHSSRKTEISLAGANNNLSNKSDKQTIPEKESVDTNKKDEIKEPPAITDNIDATVVGNISKLSESNGKESETNPDIKRSISKKLKKFTKKLSNKSEPKKKFETTQSINSTSANKKSNKLNSIVNDKPIKANDKPISTKDQPKDVFTSANGSLSQTLTSDYDSFSIYEEVSDSEFENNKHDPNYLIVSCEEFEKHQIKN